MTDLWTFDVEGPKRANRQYCTLMEKKIGKKNLQQEKKGQENKLYYDPKSCANLFIRVT